MEASMTWRLTEVLQQGCLDNRQDGMVSGRLVFQRALQPSDEGEDLSTPFEITLTLTGNLPSPFSGSAVRIENPEPPEAMYLFDFPQVQSGELIEADIKDGCLQMAWRSRTPADLFYVELDLPADWITPKVS